ncbi:MAG: prolipoprotein diacylglyceryl transferase, partial [Elusimicrobia bacterium]|nr:prolipoprotein diacylglyceryl transferase [Elusimicrobiota bacterium]
MFPAILKIGNFTLHSYGFMLALGFFSALTFLLYKAKQKNIPENIIIDLFFYTVLAGILGGRIWYVLINWTYYSKDLLNIVKIWEGGMVFYGGLIFGFITAVSYIYFKKLNFFTIADISAPALALGHFFGRIGCFLAGCCYGKGCTLPWAVKFTDKESLAPLNTFLHPAQLYEALINLLIFLILIFYDRKKPSNGKIFLTYFLLYGLSRFILEFFRGDDRGVFVLGFSQGQIFSIFILISVLIFWI